MSARSLACLDVQHLGGPYDPQLPAVGSIISGRFYVSGRILADATPTS